MRARLGAAVATLAVSTTGCSDPLISTNGCGRPLQPAARTSSDVTLSSYGISVRLPAGWSGRIVLGASRRPVLHAASSPILGANDDDSGQIARESIGPNVVYVNVRDVGSAQAPSTLRVTFSASDFEPLARARQRAATHGIEASGELYRVTAVFGGAEPPAAYLQLSGPDKDARLWASPFRMAQAEGPGTFEGLDPRTSLYGLGGRVPDKMYSATVSVFFGRPHPTPDQLASADAELARLQLPDWTATD